MDHISSYVVDTTSSAGLNHLIARELSVLPSSQDTRLQSPATEKREKYIWRMHQPSEAPRKYSIFPSKEKLPVSSGRQSPSIEYESTSSAGEKLNSHKTKQLYRRRKSSVIEPGTMTTVNEAGMDSPTIPGKPPKYESSFNENDFKRLQPTSISQPHSFRPISPRSLAPLFIPSRNAPMPLQVRTHSSVGAIGSSIPPQVPPKSTKMTAQIPHQKSAPFTHSSSLFTAPSSASITATTPNSPRDARALPKPWMSFNFGRSSPKPIKDIPIVMRQGVNDSATTLPLPTPRRQFVGHSRNQSESLAIQQQQQQQQQQKQRSGSLNYIPSYRSKYPGPRKQSEAEIIKQRSESLAQTPSHRRGELEPGYPVTDPGRPNTRSDGSPISGAHSRRTPVPTSEEQLAFEHLPQGVRVARASSKLSQSEMETLRYQAIGQVNQFEVLNLKDVDDLSRELRALDERCVYLRNTYHSLRAGRRNLHDRICSYLRSPRTARFSHDSLLKQEKALAELDSSIDDWVSKLDQAENRRSRVRQKLLEHVAAAACISVTNPKERNDSAIHIHMAALSPPRSPTRAISPILETPLEAEVMAELSEVDIKQKRESRRREVESIRIYADSDVFVLLADVEDEINRMGDNSIEDSHPEDKNPKQLQQPRPAQKKDFSDASRPEAQHRSSPSVPSPTAVPMSPFLLKPAVFVMPSNKKSVRV